MADRNIKKIHIATLGMSVLLMLGIGLGSIGVASARYQKSAMVSTVYGSIPADPSTLSAAGSTYDFGCWTSGGEDLDATIILKGAASLKGTLRFSFDGVTTEKKDIALQINGSADKEYAVSEADGRLDLPFSLVLSAQNRSGSAHLDVEWVPAGSDKATLSARYLIALNPAALCAGAERAPIFEEAGEFLTNDLLHLSLKMPSGGEGILLAQGATLSGKFPAGICYYTKAYPRGVTLLRSSVLYLPRNESGAEDLLIRREGKGAVEAVKITAGSSDQYQAATTLTPKTEEASLTVSGGNEPIVNGEKALTLTLSEASSLKDSAWNDGGTSGAQLSWELQKLSNGTFEKITPSAQIKITATRSSGGGKLEISVPGGNQPAGTYQLILKQTYNGYPIHASTVRFFVDYR